MAITGSFSTSTGVAFNLIAYYSYTQDTAANTSKVTVTLKLAHKSISASALSGSYLSVAGNKTSYSKYISQSSNTLTETTLATNTVTVAHSSSGKGTCAIKATFVLNGSYSGKSIGTLTLSETLTLKTIPRASALSVVSSMNTGSTLNVSISPSDSSFKHKVKFIVDGVDKHTSDFIAAGTTSYGYKIPHAWSPDKPSKTMTVRLYTYASNGTLIDTAEKTVTINVPATIVPTISSVKAGVSAGLDGKYVQNKSKVTITITASHNGESTITGYEYSGKNIAGTSDSYSGTAASKTSGVIQSSGTQTYKVRAKDARGRYSDWKSVDIYVYPYTAPKITSLQAQRCLQNETLDNNGTYAKLTIKTSHADVGGVNTATITVATSKDNYATSVTIASSSSASNTYSEVLGDGFKIDAAYTIRVVVTDEYGAEDTEYVELKSAQRSLNIAKYGNGVAIGGLSTVTSASAKGLFECNWDTEIKAKLTVEGFRVPEVQHGNVNITPSAANTPTSKVVTFARQFSGSPDIVASAHTSVPGTTVLGVGTASRSATECTIWLTRTNTTATTINWIAVY